MRRNILRIFILLSIIFTLNAFADVEYIGKDVTTKGNWMDKYGENGVIIFDAGVAGKAVDKNDNDQIVKGVIKSYDVGIAHH